LFVSLEQFLAAHAPLLVGRVPKDFRSLNLDIFAGVYANIPALVREIDENSGSCAQSWLISPECLVR